MTTAQLRSAYQRTKTSSPSLELDEAWKILCNSSHRQWYNSKWKAMERARQVAVKRSHDKMCRPPRPTHMRLLSYAERTGQNVYEAKFSDATTLSLNEMERTRYLSQTDKDLLIQKGRKQSGDSNGRWVQLPDLAFENTTIKRIEDSTRPACPHCENKDEKIRQLEQKIASYEASATRKRRHSTLSVKQPHTCTNARCQRTRWEHRRKCRSCTLSQRASVKRRRLAKQKVKSIG